MSGFPQSIKSWLKAAMAFIYPESCQLCEVERASAGDCFVCADCRSKVRFVEPPFCQRCGLPYEGAITTAFKCANCSDSELHFRFARSAVIARGPTREIIHRYKYNRALWFEPFLADVLIQQARRELELEHWDWIVPIPLHPTKEREREFNQAERLSVRLARATGIAMNKDLLRRVVSTRTQTLLSRQEREANVSRAFAMYRNLRLKGEKIVLIDDVFTTGATSSACARVLRVAGAGDVCVWTVARGI